MWRQDQLQLQLQLHKVVIRQLKGNTNAAIGTIGTIEPK